MILYFGTQYGGGLNFPHCYFEGENHEAGIQCCASDAQPTGYAIKVDLVANDLHLAFLFLRPQ